MDAHLHTSRHPDASALLAHLMTTPTWGPLAAMLEAIRAMHRREKEVAPDGPPVRTRATIDASRALFAADECARTIRMAAVDWLASELGGGLETLRADQVIRLALRDAEAATHE